jgi:glycosyltransferase involved in cell wall biosynthesis
MTDKKNRSLAPLVSIITVTYNAEAYLEETINSVLNQTYKNIEYIIIDGGSTDGTVDIIKKYEDKIDYWVSEKDAGIYDAMNKGLKASQGDIIGILNADDFYVSDAVENSVAALLESGLDYSVGDIIKIPSDVIISPVYPLTATIYQGMMYPHIGAFIKKEVYDKVGFFDTGYKLAADFEMAMRIHTARFRPIYVRQVIGSIHEGGVSASQLTKKENMNIAIQYGRSAFTARIVYWRYRLQSSLLNCCPSLYLKFVKKIKSYLKHD